MTAIEATPFILGIRDEERLSNMHANAPLEKLIFFFH